MEPRIAQIISFEKGMEVILKPRGSNICRLHVELTFAG